MANGAGEVRGTRASRRPLSPPGQRLLLALFVSLLATIALCVPLAYQARSARDGGVEGTPVTTSTTTSTLSTSSAPPATTATTATTGTAPVSVLPTFEDRSERLSWARVETPHKTQLLEGATVSGRVVVQITNPSDEPPVVRAEFWVDPDTATRPTNVDRTAPFTLDEDQDGAFDTTRLDDGTHKVAVKAVQADGTAVEHVSEFRVDNG